MAMGTPKHSIAISCATPSTHFLHLSREHLEGVVWWWLRLRLIGFAKLLDAGLSALLGQDQDETNVYDH